MKRLLVECADGVVNAYSYFNALPGEETDFDPELRHQIAEGETTAAKARAILGEPTSLYLVPSEILPTDPSPPEGASYVWNYAFIDKTSTGAGKDFYIYFGADDVVRLTHYFEILEDE